MMTIKIKIELGNEKLGTSEHVHAYSTKIAHCIDTKGNPFYRLEMVEGDILVCQWIPSERVFRLD